MGLQENQPTQDDVTMNGTGTDSMPAHEHRDGGFNRSGNEDRKIFVGGIAYDVSNEDLTTYFSQFGEVTQAQVKLDRATGRSRGFAFVEFATAEACKTALNKREQQIKGKSVEVKPAKSRENKKVFIGGLPADYPEDELRKHFESYGKVEDIEWPFDKQTKARRNFAFIVFEEEEAADRAASVPKQMFGSRECDVKKAVPQGKRFNGMMRGMGGMRGGYGGMMRGGAMGMQGAGSWFNANGWGQMGGLPYTATGANGGWGDWYGTPSNFYSQGGNTANAYGAYGATNASGNGFDSYSQSGSTANRNSNGQRFQQPQSQQNF